jgi:phospholipase D-like protein
VRAAHDRCGGVGRRGEVVAVTKRSWSELSDQRKRFVVVGAIVQVTLQMLALRDLRRRPVDDVRGPKALWALATFVNTVGPLAYFACGRRRHRETTLPS